MPRGAIGGKCSMFGRIFQSSEIFVNIGEGREKTGKREDGRTGGRGNAVGRGDW